MALNNRERVDKALELLRQGLGPYVERELQSEKGKAVPPETFLHSSNDPNLADKPVGEWDIAALLKLMAVPVVWNTVFRATLAHIERSLVSELRSWRNKWAHQAEFSNKDTDRVLDSASRLLTAVSATQQADEIDGMRKELLWLTDSNEKPKTDGSLIETIERIRASLARDAYPNEDSVRSQIVEPILRKLGWETSDPSEVRYRFLLNPGGSARRVDIALCVEKNKPSCIVEIKKTQQTNSNEQLFMDLFQVGTPIALIANGAKWNIYYTYGHDDRYVCTLDLREDNPTDVAQGLHRYLSREKTASGEANQHARQDLEQLVKQRKAKKELPEAWHYLLNEDPKRQIANILSRATHMRCGHTPLETDVDQFLKDCFSSPGPTPSIAKQPATKPKPDQASYVAPEAIPAGTAKSRTRGPIYYHLFGKQHVSKNAKEAYVHIITTLAQRDPGLLQRLYYKLRGRKVNHVARSRDALSLTPAAAKAAVEIPGGWWLNTNLSNGSKKKLLQEISSEADVPFGDPNGLRIMLPNT